MNKKYLVLTTLLSVSLLTGQVFAQDATVDGLVPAELPITLLDGEGFIWDIGAEGQVINGTSDAFDGGFRLDVSGNTFSPTSVLASANEIILQSDQLLENIIVQRRISVFQQIGLARFIDSFTNQSNQQLTLDITLSTNLGSDRGTIIVADESGDELFDQTDSFLITDDNPSAASSSSIFSSESSSTSVTSTSSSSINSSTSAASESATSSSISTPSSVASTSSEISISSVSSASFENSSFSSSSFSNSASFVSSTSSSFSTSSSVITSSAVSTSSAAPAFGDPAVGQVFSWFSNNVKQPVLSANLTNDISSVSYRIILRPGETVSLMSLSLQNHDTGRLLETLEMVTNDFALLMDGLNPVEVLSIGNFVQLSDSDEDGLLDLQEQALGTDPNNPDSDADGRLDRESILLDFNPELDADSDGDGVLDFLDSCIIESDQIVGADGCNIVEEISFSISETLPATPRELDPPIDGMAAFDISFANLITTAPIPEGAVLTLDTSAENITVLEADQADRIAVIALTETDQTTVEIPVVLQLASGELSNIAIVTGTVLPSPVEPDPIPTFPQVIINDAESMNASGVSLLSVFELLANEGEIGSGAELFRQLWDAQRTTSAIGSNINCIPINGFELSCDRAESDVAQLSLAEVAAEMLLYSPLAFVNRIELRNGWQDCGEHRIVYGRNDLLRNFLIIEARVPNPTPGDVRGCEAIIRHWQDMPQLEPTVRGAQMRRFFTEGLPGHGPVISVANLAQGQGQIRTNQFITREWMLREYDLAQDCDTQCRTVAIPVRVNENPLGALFNPEIAQSDDALATTAAAFQAEFASNLEPLLKDDIVMLSNPVSEQFNNGQSHASGSLTDENFFTQHFGDNLNTAFGLQLQAQLQGKTDALGNPLTVTQLLNRATAMSCAGCHEPAAFGLTEENAIGAFELLDGTVIDSWPDSLGFVHVDEQRNLSPALQNVFLPAREEAFLQVITELNTAQASSEPPTNIEVGPRINSL